MLSDLISIGVRDLLLMLEVIVEALAESILLPKGVPELDERPVLLVEPIAEAQECLGSIGSGLVPRPIKQAEAVLGLVVKSVL